MSPACRRSVPLPCQLTTRRRGKSSQAFESQDLKCPFFVDERSQLRKFLTFFSVADNHCPIYRHVTGRQFGQPIERQILRMTGKGGSAVLSMVTGASTLEK
jgi:hypothetical protein